MYRTVLAALAVLLVAPAAHADVLQERQSWSVSFGLGDSLLSAAPSGGAGNSGSPGAAVTTLSLLLERRLGESVWLLARGEGGHSSRQGRLESPPPDSVSFSAVTTNTDNTATFGSASVGLRYVFNPGGRVELSTFGIGGAGYSVEGQNTTQLLPPDVGQPSTAVSQTRALTDRTFLAGASAGLAFETSFTNNLSLRLSSSVLSATWSNTGREELLTGADGAPTAAPQKAGIKSWDAGLDFRPSLELRLRF